MPTLTPVPAIVPPTLPPLEQKMGELQVTSLRFSTRTAIALPPREGKLRRLLQLFGLGTSFSGEVALSPPTANVTINLFGHPLQLRLVGKTIYMYLHELAAHDHGRPWVRLGPSGFAELITVNGKHVRPNTQHTTPPSFEPTLVKPPFAALQKLLEGAREVREVGVATLYGQTATRFLAVVEPKQLSSASAASVAPRPHAVVPMAITPTATLEVWLAQNGLPLRTVSSLQSKETTATTTLDIPAVNFPLSIQAPPADETIGVAQLKVLERHMRRAKAKR
ncbi:MAG TPA: hypothetical protein VGL57_15010 [Solirubrobacteraceae bacterium]